MLRVVGSRYTRKDWEYMLYAIQAVENAEICFGDVCITTCCRDCKAKHACMAFDDLKIFVERKLKEYEHRN